MTKVNVKARIKRNMLAELSGQYYIDEKSELVNNLNKIGENALVGIKNDSGLYTIIGDEKIYYSTSPVSRNEMSINGFLNILTQEGLKNGKLHNYEFIKIRDNEQIWVMNAQVMNALWNTMLLFDTRIG